MNEYYVRLHISGVKNPFTDGKHNIYNFLSPGLFSKPVVMPSIMASFERVRRNMTSNAVLAKTNNRQFSIRRDPSIQVRSVSEVPNGVVVEGGEPFNSPHYTLEHP